MSGEACAVKFRVTLSTVAKRAKLGSYYYIHLVKVIWFFGKVSSEYGSRYTVYHPNTYRSSCQQSSSSFFVDNSLPILRQ